MKHFYAVLLMTALSLLAGGDTAAVPHQPGGSDAICEAVLKNGVSKETLAQMPCCAQNRGVCGCRAGRIVCCDNTFSQTCGC